MNNISCVKPFIYAVLLLIFCCNLLDFRRTNSCKNIQIQDKQHYHIFAPTMKWSLSIIHLLIILVPRQDKIVDDTVILAEKHKRKRGSIGVKN